MQHCCGPTQGQLNHNTFFDGCQSQEDKTVYVAVLVVDQVFKLNWFGFLCVWLEYE